MLSPVSFRVRQQLALKMAGSRADVPNQSGVGCPTKGAGLAARGKISRMPRSDNCASWTLSEHHCMAEESKDSFEGVYRTEVQGKRIVGDGFTHSRWLHKPPHTVAQHTSIKTTSSTTSKTLSRAFALEFRQHLVVVFGPPATELTANHGPHTTTMSSSIELPQAYAPTTSPQQGLYPLRSPHEICSNSNRSSHPQPLQTKSSKHTSSEHTPNMSAYNTNFMGQSNVAYDGTISDLSSNVYSSFVPQGSDMQLYGEPEKPQKRVSFAPLSSYQNNANGGTVCMQQIENTPSSGTEWAPLATDIPALNFDSDFSPTFTNETSGSTDPSPTLSVEALEYEGEFSNLFHGLSDFNSADPSPVILDDLAIDDQNMPSLFEAPKQFSVAPRAVSLAGYECSPVSAALASPKPAVLGAVSSGVRKNKRAAKVLPEINPDLIEDPVERKRAKNTAAARKSRQKKVDNEAELGAQIKQLQLEKQELRMALVAMHKQLNIARGLPANAGIAETYGTAFQS
ncbi:hypothetical protein M436DRAFT_64845 [Aureobasidium namibiae CBS 147.97]|uniref:BZIP domain-containing protein n=1 Tax=Aureobasidium namibiae CBS 147.97 TaxID=1043004 RepID=A0A074WG41_9PEZI